MNAILVIPEKNEGETPLAVARAALESPAISGVVFVDGWSTDDTYPVLDSVRAELRTQSGKPVSLIRSALRETGKGGAMVTGMRWALEQGAEAVMFADADITSMSPRWCDALVAPLGRAAHSRGTFDRAALDAQITRHVTRPLMAIYFPEGRLITQPLGGELVLTRALAQALLALPIAPPHTWGIDTFLTVNTVAHGYRVADVYLVQKTHNPKDLTGLRGMLLECFDEMAKQIAFHRRDEYVLEPPERLVERVEPEGIERVGDDVRTLQYTDPAAQLDRLFADLRRAADLEARLVDLEIDPDLRRAVARAADPERFRDRSADLVELWVPLLDQVTRGYVRQRFPSRFHDAMFILWQMRASAFALHEARTWEAAEEATERQAEAAFRYGARYRRTRRV